MQVLQWRYVIIYQVFFMLNKIYSLSLILLSGLSVSCATTDEIDNNKNVEPGALDLILCEEPRSQICTREYNPVCGTLEDGSFRTGSTGCTSCSDAKVVGYKMGEC